MISMSGFLHKQCRYLLQNELHALCLVAVLALIPFASWLSLAAIALITLRKGNYSGLKVVVSGGAMAIVAANHTLPMPYNIPAVLVTFILGYIAASLLRITESWKIVTAVMIAIALMGMIICHAFFPDYIAEQFQSLISMFKSIDEGSAIVRLLDGKHGVTQSLLANYLLGIKTLSIVCSALSSVILARYLQSILFYPEGFRKELLAFKASPAGVFLLIICALGTYQNNPVAISCLPILVVYLLAAGINLIFNMMTNKRDLYTISLIIVPLMVAPYVMLPVYILLGSLDSLFNFRLRLLLNTSGQKK